MYEYGSRAGVWRILELFRARGLPLTAFAVGRALELNPEIGRALAAAEHEVAGHGYRWIDYHGMPEDEERRHIRLTIEMIERICGKRPVGWYTGRVSPNTRRLVREEGGFLYSSDAYNDDLPYWPPGSPPHLVIPYTLVNNDARYLLPHGFASGEDFFALLKDAFDLLWQEGGAAAEDDERRPACADQRSPGARDGAGAVSRLRAGPRGGVGLPARGHRPALDGRASGVAPAQESAANSSGDRSSARKPPDWWRHSLA